MGLIHTGFRSPVTVGDHTNSSNVFGSHQDVPISSQRSTDHESMRFDGQSVDVRPRSIDGAHPLYLVIDADGGLSCHWRWWVIGTTSIPPHHRNCQTRPATTVRDNWKGRQRATRTFIGTRRSSVCREAPGHASVRYRLARAVPG